MDEITETDLGVALRGASEEAGKDQRPSIVAVAGALHKRVEGAADPLAALVAALEYYPVVNPQSCRENACAQSQSRIDAGVFPLLARAIAHSPRPLVAARFADLLWSARYGGTPNEWAQRAVDAYLASVYDEFGHILEVSEGLQRALEIATQSDDQPRQAAVVSALVGLAHRSIESEERSSGVSLSIIDFLAARRPADRPSELDMLLERALDRYGDDPWLLVSTLDIKARLVDRPEREKLHIAQVEAFAELARRSGGQLRYAHFQYAIELAELHDLLAIADALRNEAEGVPAPEQSSDPIERFMDRIVGDDDLTEALARFGACIPTDAVNTAPADDARERLSFFGTLAVDALARIRDHYGAVSTAGPWFETTLVDATIARWIAHAIELYEGADFHASASVLAPRLERVVRSLAGASGEAGSLRDVLTRLDGSLFEPSRRYLQTLLSDGRAGVARAPDAALLIHAACHMRLLQATQTGTVSAIT